MPGIDFDTLYMTLPQLDRQSDFNQFWESGIKEAKKTATDPRTQKYKTEHNFFQVYKLQYRGYRKTVITGTLLIPEKLEKPPVIIHLHDYNSESIVDYKYLNPGIAYYFLSLRGHENYKTPEIETETSLDYFKDHIHDREGFYAKAVYLDTLRCIDALRLTEKLNCNSIGMIGKGFGAAAAIFAAAYSDRVKALALETPAFCYLPVSQNISTSLISKEINAALSHYKGKKSDVKTNLTYFDALNFTDKISIPIMTTVGFKDRISPPECIFALFNRLLTEKYMEIYPEEGNNAGEFEQFKKSLAFLVKKIR